MLNFLPGPFLGVLSLILVSLNTVWWCPLLILFSFFKFLMPFEQGRVFVSRILIWMANAWIYGNEFALWLTQKVIWDVEGVQGLKSRDWYLLIANHRSWLDILVLQKIFNGKIPFLKFFLKQQLIWVPFLGPAWWALDFPFMKRHTREEIAKNPSLKGKDLETTRKACEKFKKLPVSVITFVEGTRFTAARHAKQKSPYKHLLIPKAGGISFTLQAMGACFHQILDVTILYPKADATLWDLFCGRIGRISVKVRSLPVPQELCQADGLSEATSQEKYRVWLNQIWTEKDQLIDNLLPKIRAEGTTFS